jgi:biotin synthase
MERYRLNKEKILECCEEAKWHGFRTFILQSGEDEYYTAEKMADIIQTIRQRFPDCAVTMSVGEKDIKTYHAYYDAGVNRFLLHHETVNSEHYLKLHRSERRIETRIRCLEQLKKIGFQIGSGIMVGLPYQTINSIIDDIYFLKKLRPEVIGISPYLTDTTSSKGQKNGIIGLTLRLLSIFRLMHPHILLPSTTALAVFHPEGREKGILAGANAVMLNLSPLRFRKNSRLYDNEVFENGILEEKLKKIGYRINFDFAISSAVSIRHTSHTDAKLLL